MNPDIENPDAGALDRIAECTYMADCSEIKSADALPLAEYVIDRAEFQNVCTQTGSSSLHIGLKGMSGDTEMFSWSGYLGCADGKFDIGYSGMGDSVYNISLFAEEKDFNEVRDIQKRILAAYEQDFFKHAPIEIVPKIRMIWNSIPSQLAKENKKFIYGLVREGGRAKEYETAIMWLCDCGLVHKVSRVNAAGIPLKAYEDLKAFKLFIVDVGLLGCMTGLRQITLLDGNDLFAEFKGALTEQYVCQQLKTIDGLGVYYYTNDRGSCEVDFIVDTGEQIVPVEVKAEVNLKAKSLRTYREKLEPAVSVRMLAISISGNLRHRGRL